MVLGCKQKDFKGIRLSRDSWPPPPPDLAVSVVGLERALMQYCSQPQDTPFDLKTVPIETVPVGPAKCESLPLIIGLINQGFPLG